MAIEVQSRCKCGGEASLESNTPGDVFWVFCLACDEEVWGETAAGAKAKWDAKAKCD